MQPDLQAIAQKIREIARAEILSRFERVGYEFKDDGSVLTEADLAANQGITDYLQTHYPEIPLLSEEMDEAQQTKLLRESSVLWCLDPLDGTSNFASGIPLFATSLALFQAGQVVLAITYDPFRDELFTASRGHGAYLNGKPLRCRQTGFELKHAVALVDFKRLPKLMQWVLLEHTPYGSQRNLGASTLEWAWMAANRGHVYLHGGMKLWDLAAGSLILAEAGGYSSGLNGEPVSLVNLAHNSVVASPDHELFTQWLAFLQTYNDHV